MVPPEAVLLINLNVPNMWSPRTSPYLTPTDMGPLNQKPAAAQDPKLKCTFEQNRDNTAKLEGLRQTA